MGKFGGEVRVVEFPVYFFLIYVSTDLIAFLFICSATFGGLQLSTGRFAPGENDRGGR